MYEDFVRAKRQLQRKYKNSCFARKWDHCLFQKKVGKAHFIITSNKAHDSRHRCNANDVAIHQLSTSTMELSTSLKFRQPLLNTMKWVQMDHKQSKYEGNDHIWESEEESTTLDSNILLAFIRVLMNRQINQSQKVLDTSGKESIQDKTSYEEHGTADQNFQFLESEPLHVDESQDSSKTAGVSNEPFKNNHLIFGKPDRSKDYESDLYSIDNDRTSPCEQFIDETTTIDDVGNNIFDQIAEMDINDPQTDNSTNITKRLSINSEEFHQADVAWNQELCITNTKEKDYIADNPILPVNDDTILCVDDQPEDYNGYQEHSEFGTESLESTISTDEIVDQQLDNRIVYNTKPTGFHAPSNAVFVCSNALLKTDVLQFGEQASIATVATDFNVNAVNKSDGDWKEDNAIENVPEIKQNMDQDNIVPEAIGDQDKENIILVPSTKPASSCWSDILQKGNHLISTRHSPGSLSVAMAALLIVTFIFITGNVFTFLALLFDVLVHAALLSLLILVAVTVMEGNQDGNFSLQDQTSIIAQFPGLLGTFTKSGQRKDGKTRSAICPSSNASTSLIEKQNDTTSKLLIGDEDSGNNCGSDKKTVNCMPLKITNTPKQHAEQTPRPEEMANSITSADTRLLNPRNYNTSATKMSFAETMTDIPETKSNSSQTDPICEDEEATVNYLPVGEENEAPEKATLNMRNVQSQADIDAQKIYDQMQQTQQRHQKNLRRLQMKFFAIRRNFHKQAGNLRFRDQQKGQFLSKLQLTLPALQKEKNRLSAEKLLFERQYTDQKRRNQELVSRIDKLNQQFHILGQTYQSVMPPNRRPQHQNQMPHGPNAFRLQPPQQEIQLQQQQMKCDSKHQPVMPASTHLTMPLQQPNLNHTANKWMTNHQQCPLFQPQQQPVPHQHHHQSRLPIFQMLYNSSVGNGVDEMSRVCKQPENLQHQHHPSQQTSRLVTSTSTSTSFQKAEPAMTNPMD